MLMRTDPFRELDRLTQQFFGPDGTLARPSAMLMDAWRDGRHFHVEFDLPGVSPDSIDIDVERNVVTVRAERPARASDAELSPRNVHAGCSAASWSWGTTWTPSTSRPATRPGSDAEDPGGGEAKPARSRSAAGTRISRPSAPDRW